MSNDVVTQAEGVDDALGDSKLDAIKERLNQAMEELTKRMYEHIRDMYGVEPEDNTNE